MQFPIDEIKDSTPLYYYDMDLLEQTLRKIEGCVEGHNFSVHYAIKANFERPILETVCKHGFGADCVSVGEVKLAVECGFLPEKIVYAGVGKTDRDIREAIMLGIGCFNVESIEEIGIINEIAGEIGAKPKIALRINPDIDAHTHHYITTGLAENKFGINRDDLFVAVRKALECENLEFIGLHFHIGSQILTPEPFRILCERVNSMVASVEKEFGVKISYVNLGGGIGIDYDDPDKNPIADFIGFFSEVSRSLKLSPDVAVHFELGRSIVAQCGSLLTRVIYVKKGVGKEFVIVDAGMNNLIRPALYQAKHLIENLTSVSDKKRSYDIVGPICESTDCFGEDVELPETSRGDILAIRSAGAYGQSMASNYNLRPVAANLFKY